MSTTTRADLRVAQTNHYRIHTDLEYGLANDLARRMDAMYDEYAKRLSIFGDQHIGKTFDVYLFAKRGDYLKFTHNALEHSGGVTIPGVNIVAAFLDDQGRDALRRTLQHEAFHQFAHSLINKNMPPWVDEGLAVMFQEGIWTGQNFLLGQVNERRVRLLQSDIANHRLIDFDKMLAMSLHDWNVTFNADRAKGTTQYNQAWAMCQFLVYARSADGRPKYRAKFLDMLQRMHADVPPLDAFTQAFSPNIAGFEARFLEWAGKLRPTPEATLIDHQNILAEMLAKFSHDGRQFGSVESFQQTMNSGHWRLSYNMDGLEWQSAADPRIYFLAADGHPYTSDELFFDLRDGAPLPDLVLHCRGQLQLRTIFHDLPGGMIEHETLVEGAAR